MHSNSLKHLDSILSKQLWHQVKGPTLELVAVVAVAVVVVWVVAVKQHLGGTSSRQFAP
jgi:hypothetical protein